MLLSVKERERKLNKGIFTKKNLMKFQKNPLFPPKKTKFIKKFFKEKFSIFFSIADQKHRHLHIKQINGRSITHTHTRSKTRVSENEREKCVNKKNETKTNNSSCNDSNSGNITTGSCDEVNEKKKCV